MKNKNIDGVLLAGGKSSRMGQNKLFLEFGEEFLLQRMYNFISMFFDNIVVVSNIDLNYSWLNCKVIPDVFVGKGPLGGIHSALLNSEADKIFVIAVDTPFLGKEIIDRIASETEYELVATKNDGFINPLPLLVSKSCLKYIEKSLSSDVEENMKSKKLSIMNLFDNFSNKIIELGNDSIIEMFNVNTPNDYEEALRIFKKQGEKI